MQAIRVAVPALFVVLLSSLPSGPSYGQVDDPALQAQEVIAGLLSRIETVSGNDDAEPAEKRALVEREIDLHLNYGRLARAALGPLAERFSQDQIADFSREYARYLGYMLLQQAATDTPERSKIVGASYDEQTGRAVVRTTGAPGLLDFPGIFIVFGGHGMSTRVQRDFTLSRVYGQWRILSLQFNGINVSKNFRAQFQAVLDRSDADALITDLRMRNDANAQNNPFDRIQSHSSRGSLLTSCHRHQGWYRGQCRGPKKTPV